MSNPKRRPVEYQRNALAPGLLAALVCLVAAFLTGWEGNMVFRYAIAILAVICAWFAIQARRWWWLAVYVPIIVVWNPVLPFQFSGPVWMAGHIVAGAGFLIAGMLLKSPRAA
ncbi:MAG: hypothetical protein J7480_03220 [Microbacteriaceae bacterium]|nr:hypothetical protein [Microbacteriaceae bacterium]